MYHDVYDNMMSGLSLWEGASYFSPHIKKTTNKQKPQKLQNQRTDLQPVGVEGRAAGCFLGVVFSLFAPFFSFRCLFGSHPSPSIPCFCLCHINAIRAACRPHWHTFSLSVGLSFTRTHVRKHTDPPLARTPTQKGAVDKVRWAC